MLDGVKLHLVENADDVSAFQQWLGERRRVLAVDTETTGLDWWMPHFRCRLVQFGDEMHGWAMSWEDWRGLAVDTLRRYEGPIVGHHWSYDAHVLSRADARLIIPWDRCHDTMVKSHLVEPRGYHGLKPLGRKHFGLAAVAGQDRLRQVMAARGWEWDTVPVDLPEYWAYGALDCVLTARLDGILSRQIDELGLWDVLNLERAVQRILWGMEERGFPIDRVLCSSTRRQCEAEAERLHGEIRAEYGVGCGSPKQMVELLQSMGVELTKRTKSGALAVDEDALLTVAGAYGGRVAELCGKVLAYRGVAKIAGTYLSNIEKRLDPDDRLHAGIKQLGARTGRMSVAEPSLQNLPRGTEVRDVFIPSPGHQLLSSDFDQIEVRLAAHFAKDQKMVDAIHSGDFHTMTARYVYGDPDIQKDDPRRGYSKNGIFAQLYGAQPARFAGTVGISLERAKEVMDGLSAAYPGMHELQQKVISTGRKRLAEQGEAWVKTPLGRREVGDPDKIYALTNYLIQGSAADVLKRALVRLDAAGLGDYMLLPVHDEVLFDVPDELVPELSELIPATMLDTEWLVPLTADCAAVSRWGDKYRKAGAAAPRLVAGDDEA